MTKLVELPKGSIFEFVGSRDRYKVSSVKHDDQGVSSMKIEAVGPKTDPQANFVTHSIMDAVTWIR